MSGIGYSPPVVTEVVEWLVRARVRAGSRLFVGVVSTGETRRFVKVVEAAVKCRRYRGVDVVVEEIPLSVHDVDSRDGVLEVFVKTLGYLAAHGPVRYVSVAGGRKSESVAMALAAQVAGALVVHAVLPDVKTFNIELEKVRGLIEEVAESENPVETYRRYREELDRVMFPRGVEVFEIPIVPLPPKVLDALAAVARGNVLAEDIDEEFGRGYSELLKRCGLVSKVDGRLVPTDTLKRLLEVIAHA